MTATEKKGERRSYPLFHIPYYYYLIYLFKNIYILIIVENVEKWITSFSNLLHKKASMFDLTFCRLDIFDCMLLKLITEVHRDVV